MQILVQIRWTVALISNAASLSLSRYRYLDFTYFVPFPLSLSSNQSRSYWFLLLFPLSFILPSFSLLLTVSFFLFFFFFFFLEKSNISGRTRQIVSVSPVREREETFRTESRTELSTFLLFTYVALSVFSLRPAVIRCDWFLCSCSDPRERSRLHMLCSVCERVPSSFSSLIYFSLFLPLPFFFNIQSLLFHRSIIVGRNSFGPFFVLFPVWLFFFFDL